MVINFKLLTPTARVPLLNHETDAGIDFFSDEEFVIGRRNTHLFSTGVAWEPYFDAREDGFGMQNFFKIYMQIQGRSGLASKNGIGVMGGVIDPAYRGEIKIILINTTGIEYKVSKGDKIAQGIVHFIPHYTIKIAKDLGETSRGEKGFGSSDLLGQ